MPKITSLWLAGPRLEITVMAAGPLTATVNAVSTMFDRPPTPSNALPPPPCDRLDQTFL